MAKINSINNASYALTSDTSLTATAGAITATAGNVVITSGNLTLPQSTSTIGQIQITGIGGTTTVMHNHTSSFMLAGFGPNIYIGENTGDKTTNGIYAYGGCIGIGNNILPSFSYAYDMIGIGSNVFKSAVGARDCIAIGYNALTNLVGSTGIEGPQNLAIGHLTGAGLVDGGYNVMIGTLAGASIGASSESNIYICHVGANESHVMRIGTSGSGDKQVNKSYIAGIYGVTPAGTLNIALVDSNDQLGSVASLGVAQGGTGAATLTDHGVLLGSGTGAITPTAVGATGEVLIGNTGADASWSASPTVTTMYATTFDTNVAAAKLQMAGTTITATGSNTDVGMTVTPKGAGNLTLTTGSVAITSGNLKLPTTSSTVGQITINNSAWAHAYGTANVFIGGAGNFTFTTANASANVGIGTSCLVSLTGAGAGQGAHNSAYGYNCGGGVTTGSSNSFYGVSAGNSTTTGSNNICIGESAVATAAGASNELVIGSGTGTGTGNINKAYISGITGITVTGTAVLISTANQLGIAASSVKYKKDIEDMPNMSQVIDKLRPVTFHYKDEKQSAQLNYGLIAEEVEQVWPEMVAYDKDGQISTLYYQFLAPVLVQEVQRLNSVISALETRISALENS